MLSQHVAKVSVVMISVVPEEMKQEFSNRIKKLNAAWKKKIQTV